VGCGPAPGGEYTNLLRRNVDYDIRAANSLYRFLGSDSSGASALVRALKELADGEKPVHEDYVSGEGLLKFSRKAEPKGPLAVFAYDYFGDHLKAAGVATPKLLSYEGLWGAGEEYAYEVLNFVNGKGNAQEIRDAVSSEYGPVPLELVVEYLKALEKIGVVEGQK